MDSNKSSRLVKYAKHKNGEIECELWRNLNVIELNI